MITRFTFFTMLILFSISSFSQGIVKGKIVEKGTNETLIGASVVVEGTTIGTVSDFDGNFSIQRHA